jgi:hypothetical protein
MTTHKGHDDMTKGSNGKGEKKEIKRFTTPVFRVSFPHLFEATKASDADKDAKPKFSLSAIWTPGKFSDKDKALWAAIGKELNRVALEAFKKPWKDLPDNIKRGLRDGAAKEGLDGYGEGTKFANLTTYNRPGVVNLAKEPIGPEHGNADEIYPGCYARATVSVYSYGLKPGSKGKGVAIGLFNVQKVKDGPRLDNRVAAEDDFDEELDSEWLDESDDDFGDDDTGSAGDEDDEIPF